MKDLRKKYNEEELREKFPFLMADHKDLMTEAFFKGTFGEIRYKLDGTEKEPFCIYDGKKWIDASHDVVDLVRAIANHYPKSELVETGKNNYYRVKLGGGVVDEEKLRNDADSQEWDFDAEVSSGYLIPVQWDVKTQSWRDAE